MKKLQSVYSEKYVVSQKQSERSQLNPKYKLKVWQKNELK